MLSTISIYILLFIILYYAFSNDFNKLGKKKQKKQASLKPSAFYILILKKES